MITSLASHELLIVFMTSILILEGDTTCRRKARVARR